MACTLPEHITEQLEASEEFFNSLDFFALNAECVKAKGQLLCFEVMAGDIKQLKFSTGMRFVSLKAWWEYLKCIVANVVSNAHVQLYLATKISFP